MLAKNQINRNKMDNRAKIDKNNLDFMPFIQNDINGLSNGSNSKAREGCEECRPRSGKDDEGVKGFYCTNT